LHPITRARPATGRSAPADGSNSLPSIEARNRRTNRPSRARQRPFARFPSPHAVARRTAPCNPRHQSPGHCRWHACTTAIGDQKITESIDDADRDSRGFALQQRRTGYARRITVPKSLMSPTTGPSMINGGKSACTDRHDTIPSPVGSIARCTPHRTGRSASIARSG
jgi:hypothetical protein